MAEGFEVEIFTPAGLALQDRATQVTLPSSTGEIGVLEAHIKYTGLLGTGIFEYLSETSKAPCRLVVSGGFCSFSGEHLVLLADSVDFADQVDRDAYAAERANFTQVVEREDTQTPDWQHAKKELDRIEAIDRLISH